MLDRPAMRAPLVAPLLTASLLAALPACSSDDGEPGRAPDAAGDDGDTPDAAVLLPDAAPETVGFRRFTRAFGGGPCPDDIDCAGSIELRQNRRLLVDREGEFPVVVHEATVSPADLERVAAILSDPALVALLDRGEPPCDPPSDSYDTMTLLDDAGETHANSVTGCADDPIAAARAALDDLAATYVP
jgi:hypothetical protein